MSSSVGRLATLADGVIHGDGEVVVNGVTHDSGEAGPGILFMAVPGERFDGHDFVPEAVAAGSPAICVERPMGSGVTELVVARTREVMGPISSHVYGDPSQDLEVIGVTGTNGKTTVTHYIDSIARSSGYRSGLIGTIETRLGDASFSSERTTPEAPRFQHLLAEMRDRGAGIVSVEVSSHALEMGRVAGTRFAVAAFTNLSQDHLDYHGSMDAYRAAKLRLFEEYEVGTAVVNVDDPVGSLIAESFPGRLTTVGGQGEVSVRDVETSLRGSTFRIVSPEGTAAVSAPVVGRFNVDNLLMAMASCLAVGIPLARAVEATAELGGVPGRFELVSGESPVSVIVDYAHTPEGIRKAIDVAREITGGRVIALVGAGGDRDREKRPLMGRAAAGADLAVITSDNPRSEDPRRIIAEVRSGVERDARSVVEPNRERAIEVAVTEAEAGDVVLILGKGHETGQEIEGEVHPFDDRLVAREALAKARSATGEAHRSRRPSR